MKGDMCEEKAKRRERERRWQNVFDVKRRISEEKG